MTGCAPIDLAGAEELAFLANARYARHLEATSAAAVIVGEDVACPDALSRIVCADPYFAFRNAMIELHGFRRHPDPMDAADAGDEAPRVSPRANVHPAARIGAGAQLHPGCTVERDAEIGPRAVLYPGAYVGEASRVGADSVLFPNVVVYDRCMVGDRVTLHAGTVIGQDGFGYATHAGAHHKIPQAGSVVIEDDVELGAACAIERAAMGETRIGRGTKFADLISIGHGTTIGAHCLFVSLVGVSGSVKIGNYVVLGGQTGVTGHLEIGDGVQAAGKSAIAGDVPAGRRVAGVPAIELDQAKRNALAATDLYGLFKRVRKLERELDRLRQT